jgi:hypothetical protein
MSLGNSKRKNLSISQYTCVAIANSTYQAATIENYFHFLRCFFASPLLHFRPRELHPNFIEYRILRLQEPQFYTKHLQKELVVVTAA